MMQSFSTICFAKALPDDGKVVTLELDEKHADVSKISRFLELLSTIRLGRTSKYNKCRACGQSRDHSGARG